MWAFSTSKKLQKSINVYKFISQIREIYKSNKSDGPIGEYIDHIFNDSY